MFTRFTSMSTARISVCALLIIAFAVSSALGQMEDDSNEPERRKSPLSMARVKHNDTYVKITYGQPFKRGRDIFGGLVSYDKVWRTGANEATEITVTEPIKLAGNTVDPGTYSFFTIPKKEEWTIILNNELGQWGAFKYDKSKDYLRFKVPSSKMDKTVEAFTMKFSKPKNNATTLSMMWDQTKVEIPVEFK